jgi:hypothetical protein
MDWEERPRSSGHRDNDFKPLDFAFWGIPEGTHRCMLLKSEIFVTVGTELTASVVWWSEARVRSSALPDFLRSSGSGTGSTQAREYN